MDGWIQNFRDTICLQMTAEQQKVWVYQNYQQVSYYQQMMAMQAQQSYYQQMMAMQAQQAGQQE